MKFSILLELQLAGPTPERERQLFHDCVAQVELADRLGYHAVWEVEHHGLYEYSHSSAPEIFLSYVAARTRNIRLGHGVTLTPTRYNHPIRIAERIATLDILSKGRVNWGSGKSAAAVEQRAFEIDPRALHAQWAEAVRMIPRMWAEEVFSWNGEFYKIPPTRILPKPVQQPHPPMFAACTKPDSAVAVGALGLGALNFAVGNDAALAQKVVAYKEAVKAARPQGYGVTNHFASAPPCLVLADDKKACEYGFRGARYFIESLSSYYFTSTSGVGVGQQLPVPRDFLSEPDLESARISRNTSGAQLASIIGDPAAARETVARFQASGVDELLLVMQMGTVPHELILESLTTFAEQVMPHFAG
jgi:alkanesulfonate monooxygenase SsuD/methylene tetrahydromethanopterin reductase-like flavin-dependent oxidoreductase (luciferase family)